MLRQEFAINVTGGTNVMASGSILSAMLLGTKAYYVLNRDKNPGQKSYVRELPIPSVGIVKMNETQQKVLNMISKSYFEVKHPKKNGEKHREGPGIMANQELLDKLWKKKEIKYGTRKRQKGETNLTYVISELRKKGYVEKIDGVEEFVKKITIGSDGYTKEKFVIKINESKVKWKITPAGRRQARNAVMLKE